MRTLVQLARNRLRAFPGLQAGLGRLMVDDLAVELSRDSRCVSLVTWCHGLQS